jgi:hypothetical protein
MKKLGLSILAILAINNHTFLIAQRGSCTGEHNYCFPEKEKNKGAAKDSWQYNNQSKSGLFAQNETTEINLVTYSNTEYMLAFCSDNDMLEGKIQFKLYDYVTKQVEKKKPGKYKFADPNDTAAVPRMIERDTVYTEIAYEKSKKLLFDNAKKENVQHFEFISEKTRKMLVEVYVPSVDGGAEASTSKGKKGADDKEIKAASYSCVGMLVMHQKALATGFQK